MSSALSSYLSKAVKRGDIGKAYLNKTKRLNEREERHNKSKYSLGPALRSTSQRDVRRTEKGKCRGAIKEVVL